MSKLPTKFQNIDSEMNAAYGKLREHVRESGYVPNANTRASSVDIYALGYIFETLSKQLPAEDVERLLDGRSPRSAAYLQALTPILVQMALDQGRTSIKEIVEFINDRERFTAFAEEHKANPGNRARGAIKARNECVYLWLNCEGWVKFGPYEWLRFDDQKQEILGPKGHVIALKSGTRWTIPLEKWRKWQFSNPTITSTPEHPHPQSGDSFMR